MPHYDESFIHDDNQNQRRNKRSYRVYKTGLSPLHLLERSALALEERGTSAIKRNIKNIKHRNNRNKSEPPPQPNGNPAKYKTPDIIVDHCPRLSVYNPNKYNDIRNNNVLSLSPCKSFDNLVLNQTKQKVFGRDSLRNGISLQNLADEESLQHYSSPSEHCSTAVRRDDIRNSYSVLHAKRRPMQRCFSRVTAAPGVGVYRQIPCDGETGKDDHGMQSLFNITNINDKLGCYMSNEVT